MASYIDTIVPDFPAHLWKMQDTVASAKLADSIGSMDISTKIGTPTLEATSVPPGIDVPVASDLYCQFNGSGTPFDPSGFYLNDKLTETDNFSFEFWFKKNAAPGIVGVVFTNYEGSTKGWAVIMNADSTLYVDSRNSGGVHNQAQFDGGGFDTAWHYVVIVRDSGTWKYYKDAVLNRSNAGTDTPDAPGSGGYVAFGTNQNSGTAAYAQPCSMAWAAYYTYVLSQDQITAHYNAAGRQFVPQIEIILN